MPPSLNPGDTLISSQLTEIFRCSAQGGMRRSLKTQTLVIVAKHFDKVYEDRWQDDVFHYTGMGRNGNQRLDRTQNRTLRDHETLGVSVHLFEQFVPAKYHYQGEVSLSDNPYQERQPDVEGNDRLVWVFPLKLKVGDPVPEPLNQYRARFQKRETKAAQLSPTELKKRAQLAKGLAGRKRVSTFQHERDENVAAYAKHRAAGFCDLCERLAPFLKKGGEPYLEVHHIIWLARGGEDTISNTVALCPNCHRKMHSLNLQDDVSRLTGKSRSYK